MRLTAIVKKHEEEVPLALFCPLRCEVSHLKVWVWVDVQLKFNAGWFDDAEETVLLESICEGQRQGEGAGEGGGGGARVEVLMVVGAWGRLGLAGSMLTPLVHQPGRVVLTAWAVYFQPFNVVGRVGEDGEGHLHL